MYERIYGAKYDKNLSTVQIAALVRAEIEAARKSGHLPAGKYSVRKTHHNSIHVDVRPVGEVFEPEYLRDDAYLTGPCTIVDGVVTRPSRYLPAAQAAVESIEVMLAAYNHDGSDTQSDYFDLKFYATVNVRSDYSAARAALLASDAADYSGEAAMARSDEVAPLAPIYDGAEELAPEVLEEALVGHPDDCGCSGCACRNDRVAASNVLPFAAPVRASEEPEQVRFMREMGLA